jgi:hypothetical protein
VEISGSGLKSLKYARHGKRNATDVFRAEVGFEQVLYRLALHAQSLFTAAACLGRRDELVLPGGYSAADLVSATLLKLLDPFNTSVTWETGRNDVAAAGRMAHAVLANIFHCWRSRSGLSNCSSFCASPCCQFGCCRSSYPGTIATPAAVAARRSSASIVAKGKRNRIANASYAAS